MMPKIKYFLSMLLASVFLSACALPANFSNSTPRASPANTNTPAQIQSQSATTSSVTPETLVGTPVSGIGQTTAATQPAQAASIPDITASPYSCQLEPVSQPPWPDKIPGPNELDPETGLHRTGTVQMIDLATYRLKVTGLVDRPLSLTYDELRCMPSVTDNPELVCPGVFVDRATWTGVPIKDILALAGVQPGAKKITLVSADGYEVHLPLETALADENFLAYEVDGKPLPVLHGFPLRAVFPEMWGSNWLKWLVEIRIS